MPTNNDSLPENTESRIAEPVSVRPRIDRTEANLLRRRRRRELSVTPGGGRNWSRPTRDPRRVGIAWMPATARRALPVQHPKAGWKRMRFRSSGSKKLLNPAPHHAPVIHYGHNGYMTCNDVTI
jgi:hypothetical protein